MANRRSYTPKHMSRVLPGLYRGEQVRAERETTGKWAGTWKADVLLKRIGETDFYEFSSTRGLWHTIGHFTTLEAIEHNFEALRSGSHVLRRGCYIGGCTIPDLIVPWANVADEIARHPSVSGETPKSQSPTAAKAPAKKDNPATISPPDRDEGHPQP